MSETPTQKAVSLVAHRRQLLADAKKHRAGAQRLVRRCERAVREAEEQMTAVIVGNVDV